MVFDNQVNELQNQHYHIYVQCVVSLTLFLTQSNSTDADQLIRKIYSALSLVSSCNCLFFEARCPESSLFGVACVCLCVCLSVG